MYLENLPESCHSCNMGLSGVLSNVDVKREIDNNNLKIYPMPYSNSEAAEKVQIKAASIDITPSCLIMSVRTGRLLKIYSKKNPANNKDGENRYVFIEPRDTALVISREYFIVPNNICGNVYSRVSTVSAGLGHISTTIDPGWKGALLIAVSNPSSERKRLDIQRENMSDCPLATVTFSYLCTPADIKNEHPKMPARVDILKRYMGSENYWTRFYYIQKCISTAIHYTDFKLTNSIIAVLEKQVAPEEWSKILLKLEESVLDEKIVVSRRKTWALNILRLFFNLLISFVVFAVVFSVIYAISTPTNNESVLKIWTGILRGNIPKDFNASIISLVISVMTFCKGIINDSRRK